MFNCQMCHKTTEPGQKANIVPVETREVTYFRREFIRGREIMVEEGRGHETVRESMVCDDCVGKVRVKK